MLFAVFLAISFELFTAKSVYLLILVSFVAQLIRATRALGSRKGPRALRSGAGSSPRVVLPGSMAGCAGAYVSIDP